MKNSFAIAGASAVPPARRQRRQDHRRVHVALMVRGEDHRAVEVVAGARSPSTRSPGEQRARAAESRSAGSTRRIARASHDRFHAGKSTGSAGGASLGGALLDERAQLTEIARARERAFVDPRLERVLERDHQLDALERAQARAPRASSSARDSSRPAYFASSAASASVPCWTRRGAAPRLHPLANRRALEFPRAFGARQLGLGPHQRAPDLLMIARAARWPARTTASGSMPGVEHEHRVHALLAIRCGTPTTAESRTPGNAFSTRSTSSGKTFSPSGVTIISFLRPRMYSWPSSPISPMSPVWNQPSSNARAVSSSRVEVALRHVLAAHEDLAVGRDLHLDAGDRLADRSLLASPNGWFRRDDRRGLGQAVALDDDEAELAPRTLRARRRAARRRRRTPRTSGRTARWMRR